MELLVQVVLETFVIEMALTRLEYGHECSGFRRN